jgi:hypothetical protein
MEPHALLPGFCSTESMVVLSPASRREGWGSVSDEIQ